MIKLYQNKDWLNKKYNEETLTCKEIAKICKVSQSTIQNYVKPLRNRNNRLTLSQNNILDFQTKEIITGCLLGDGTLQNGKISSRFGYSCKDKEIIEWIKNKLNKTIGSCPIIDRKQNRFGKDLQSYGILSHACHELLKLRKTWYPNNTKIVPSNIELTPTICLFWYLGDGSLHFTQKGTRYINLHTECFSKKCIEMLANKLNKLNVKTTINKKETYSIIRISCDSTELFLNYMEPNPIRYFDYKWRQSK